jgi:predicted protein tyrosine phosphatase
MIIVSSLDHAEAAFKKYAPAYVISILERDEPTPPVFDAVRTENHLKVIEDCSRAVDVEDCESRCKKLLALAERWRNDPEPKAPILIHCHKGVARSMAVAYVLMCAIEQGNCERKIADRLRAAAPHADPNLMLVSEADALMHRDDRMIEAILDLCPSCAAVEKPVVTLPVTA